MANFNYTPNVKCVNGIDTWIELDFTNYVGDLVADITAISVTGPSGVIVNDINNFIYYPETQYIMYIIEDQVPEIGTYDFSVTIDGETVVDTDEQSVNRTIAIVDTQTMVPASDSTTQTSTTFTWDAVADPGYTVYYGIQIRNLAGDYIANVRYIGDFQYNINLDPGQYRWQVITMDGIDWKSSNNRSHGNWVWFTIEES